MHFRHIYHGCISHWTLLQFWLSLRFLWALSTTVLMTACFSRFWIVQNVLNTQSKIYYAHFTVKHSNCFTILKLFGKEINSLLCFIGCRKLTLMLIEWTDDFDVGNFLWTDIVTLMLVCAGSGCRHRRRCWHAAATAKDCRQWQPCTRAVLHGSTDERRWSTFCRSSQVSILVVSALFTVLYKEE